MDNTKTARLYSTWHSPGSANDLANAQKWKVVGYERDMFFATLAMLKNRTPVVDENQVLRNAVIESAIIHARNLCCIFLSVPSRERGEILLRDLTSTWEQDPERAKLIRLLEKAFFQDPVNGATVFDAFSERITYAVDRRGDAENYSYAAEFVAINGLVKAIVENLEATLNARSTPDR